MYTIPKDIPKVTPFWRTLTLQERYTIAKAEADKRNYPNWVALIATTISLVEQPHIYPNFNLVGIMPFAQNFPYGWAKYLWDNMRPIGYAMIKEGTTKKRAPFLAFAAAADSLAFCVNVVYARQIRTGYDYADKWAGVRKQADRDRVAQSFEQVLNRVQALAVAAQINLQK